MRVLHLAPLWYPTSEDSFGGIETYLPALIDGLAELGCEQSLLAAGDSHTGAELIPACERNVGELMDAGSAWEIGPYEQHQLTLAIELADGFDVVHSHLGWGGFALSAVDAVRGRMLHTLHNDVTPDVSWYVGRHPDLQLTVVSCFQLEQLRHAGARHCEVVPNAVVVERFPFSDGHDGMLAFLGRMEPAKGPDLAIEVAQHLGRSLVLAGVVTDEQFFEDRVEPALGSSIRYVGVLDHAGKCELLSGAACTLMPSRWEEPFGLVALESQACGTPVVALGNGGLPEVIEPGVTGFLTTEEDRLPALVSDALALDRHTIRRRVTERFGIERVASRYLSLYEEIAGR
jgi:glycosyltransferase involved in cell wall biosynthesis